MEGTSRSGGISRTMSSYRQPYVEDSSSVSDHPYGVTQYGLISPMMSYSYRRPHVEDDEPAYDYLYNVRGVRSPRAFSPAQQHYERQRYTTNRSEHEDLNSKFGSIPMFGKSHAPKTRSAAPEQAPLRRNIGGFGKHALQQRPITDPGFSSDDPATWTMPAQVQPGGDVAGFGNHARQQRPITDIAFSFEDPATRCTHPTMPQPVLQRGKVVTSADHPGHIRPFTISDDGLLKGMRQEGTLWDEIAGKLGRSISACKERYIELLERERTGERDPNRTLGGLMDDTDASKKPFRVADYPACPNYAPDGNRERTASPAEKAGDEWPPRKGDRRGSKQQWQTRWQRITTTEERDRQVAQRLYAGMHVVGAHCPDEPRINLRAGPPFTSIDCQILANIDADMRVNRWKYMQASLFNFTGRMIPAEKIRERFEEAQVNEARRAKETNADESSPNEGLE